MLLSWDKTHMNYTKRAQELNQTFGQVLQGCPQLTLIGDPVLRQKTTAVSVAEGLVIAQKLQETLLKYRQLTGLGRGLAAPQIGEAKAVFVTYLNDTFKIYLNPKIVALGPQLNFYRESCLSGGYLSAEVKRPATVTLEYTNEQGQRQTEQAEGLTARLLQHEYDHLEGVVNLDKAEAGSISFMFNDPLEEKLRAV